MPYEEQKIAENGDMTIYKEAEGGVKYKTGEVCQMVKPGIFSEVTSGVTLTNGRLVHNRAGKSIVAKYAPVMEKSLWRTIGQKVMKKYAGALAKLKDR